MRNQPFEPDATMSYEEIIDFFASVAKVNDVDIVQLLADTFDIRARYAGDGLYEVESEP